MLHLFRGSAVAHRACRPHPHRLRLHPPVRAFDWEPLNKLRDRLPSLSVLRERFPVRWPRLPQDGRDEDAQPKESSQQNLQPPRLSVREARQQETLGFGFSAGGLLFPYYIGVTETLTELGVLTGLFDGSYAQANLLIFQGQRCWP